MTNLERYREWLAEADPPTALVNNLTNVRWLTSFTGSFAYVIVTPESGVFVTDSRYKLQAEDEVRVLPSSTFSQPVEGEDFLLAQLRELHVDRLGVDAHSISVATLEKWKARFEGVVLIPREDGIAQLRKIKSAEEIAMIRRACDLADTCLEHLLSHVAPGRTEKALLWEIHRFLHRRGAEPSFPPIVVSGERSARPHGIASDKKLEEGDFLTIDLGARLDGYCSDITRTVVVGRSSERQREVYEQVRVAQAAAIAALVPGANGRDIDGLVRRILDEKGLARFFGHGLGHGLGMEVHDGGRLSSRNDELIAPGQVWTIEPGVYIDGLGGVRIEDDVVVTESGPEVLTTFPKELIEVA